jgi:hypothetical protein
MTPAECRILDSIAVKRRLKFWERKSWGQYI